VTHRDYVIAQIKHQQTDYIPYDFRIDQEPAESLDKFYGSPVWREKLQQAILTGPDIFDVWGGVRKSLDPNDPSKFEDIFGNQWTQGRDILHLDRIGMYGVEPQDYKWPVLEDFLQGGRLENARRWYENAPKDRFVCINMGAGHWEHVWRLLGVEDAMILTIDDPELFDDIVEHLDVLLNQFLDVVLDFPADAVFICDDWCDQRTCMFGAATWRRHFKPRLEKFYKRVHDSGKYVIQHVCGNVEPLIPDLIEIGLDVLESVQSEAMDVRKIKQLYGDKLAFYGALGVQNLVNFGTPDQIREEIRMLRRELGKNGGFILAPAKQLNRSVPIENLVAIYEEFIEEDKKFR